MVSILLDNAPDIQDSIVVKLLKLYREHEILSVKIIGVLNSIDDSIESGNGEKIEAYSEIEKKLIVELMKINLIIKSYESMCSSTSEELNKTRAFSLSSHKTIQVMDKIIRGKLKILLSSLSLQINKFSMESFYNHTSNIIPQFVDLSI